MTSDLESASASVFSVVGIQWGSTRMSRAAAIDRSLRRGRWARPWSEPLVRPWKAVELSVKTRALWWAQPVAKRRKACRIVETSFSLMWAGP